MAARVAQPRVIARVRIDVTEARPSLEHWFFSIGRGSMAFCVKKVKTNRFGAANIHTRMFTRMFLPFSRQNMIFGFRFSLGSFLFHDFHSSIRPVEQAVVAYRPVWTRFVDRFARDAGAKKNSTKVDAVPHELLTDINMSIFIEEQWGTHGMPDGSYKKLRGALFSAWQGEGLGVLDWKDSKRFPRCWIVCKVRASFAL